MHGPVTITYHGRPRYVLLAAESWDAEQGAANGTAPIGNSNISFSSSIWTAGCW